MVSRERSKFSGTWSCTRVCLNPTHPTSKPFLIERVTFLVLVVPLSLARYLPAIRITQPVAELIGVTSWPAAISWTLLYPISYVSAFWLGILRDSVGQLESMIGPATVLAVTLIANSLYFSQLESFVKFPRTGPAPRVPFPVPLQPASYNARLDTLVVMAATLLVTSGNYTDVASGGWCSFGSVGIIFPWSCVPAFFQRVAYAYFLVTGLSLLLHYARRWVLLGKSITVSSPPAMPSDFEPVSWGGWEGRWRVYCEGLRAITAIFFKGFSTLMFIVTTVTVVWVFAWYQGWVSSSHPAFLSSIGVALISFAIYLRGPSIAAWLKVDRIQKRLRETAVVAASDPETSKVYPPLDGYIDALAEEQIFVAQHGTPKAVAVAFGSYFSVVLFLVKLILFPG